MVVVVAETQKSWTVLRKQPQDQGGQLYDGTLNLQQQQQVDPAKEAGLKFPP